MIEEKIRNLIKESLKNLEIEIREISLEHPDEISHGDYSTNVALVHAKAQGANPRKLAEEIVRYIEQNKSKEILKVEIAGPGFINFYLSREFFTGEVLAILKEGEDFGKNSKLEGKKVMVEYTDPNPFKEFHIGHLMSNAVGESISRLVQFQAAEVKRACYQGDVGLHVAKAVWGMKEQIKNSKLKIQEITAKNLGEVYALGSEKYETDEAVKAEIISLNKAIFDKSDAEMQVLYEKGRKVSLDYFETIYRRLGTNFDYKFFESETGPFGKKIVEEFLGHGIFEKSQGAVVFPGEKHGLHTRVFINSQGLPTYEAKELGLAKIKYDIYKYDQSIVVTANEVNEYFKVLLCVMNLTFPELAKKTKHLSHGMLRLPTGKMSSRTGNIITGESLISAVEAMVHKKLEERELEIHEKSKIAEIVAIGAIKYSILKQAIGSDIIYDFEKSISFEGDSGPYLQYACVRATSVLEKAKKENIKAAPPGDGGAEEDVSLLEKMLSRFPEIVERASSEYSPHFVATYLTELAGSFNNYYAHNQIVNSSDPQSPYKVAITESFVTVMKNGLWLLGIKVPEHM
ncbi:MAG: arginine--tRNA ligase [Candidatus Taylorbacteria bacterium]|nr:arginine--tRNA ligase [Candidatus Taylorbacteria bacterium]